MKKALFLMMCLCFSISVLAQAKTVTGTVVDAIGRTDYRSKCSGNGHNKWYNN